MPFSSLGFSPDLLALLQPALGRAGYVAPTPIQERAIPAILHGHDLLARARTGSGKTAAFALPLLQRFALASRTPPRRVRSLVLVPTRELAAQVGDTFVQLGRHLSPPPKVAAVSGGVSINPQMIDLRRGADIVVATPGRLLDLVDNNALSLAHVDTLVLDEADRLLDLGFEEELRRILAQLPPGRQTLLFSATFPSSIQALASELLHEPERIDVQGPSPAAPDIRQRGIEVDPGQRTRLLRHLLQEEGWGRALVFVASKHAAEVVAAKLCKAGIRAEALHGDLSQGRRTRVLLEFKQGQVQALVATDLASRGIDIVELPVVVNYDLPRSTTDYTHRIGRTGRAGQSGVAISFISADTAAHFRLIEKRGRFHVARERIAGFEPVEVVAANPTDPAATGGIKGARPSKKDKLRAAAALEKLKDPPV